MQTIPDLRHHSHRASDLALDERLLEQRLVDIRVKLLPILRVDFRDSVPLEHFLELYIRHAESVVERVQVCIVLAQDLLRNALRRLRQDVCHLKQVLAEALDAEYLGVANLLLHASSDVLRLGERPFVAVLQQIRS